MIEGITIEQRQVLSLLAKVVPPSAYLAGGVAVALRFHHRLSRDLDLFVETGNPEELADRLQGTGKVTVLSRADGTLHAEVAGVPVSVLRYSYPLLSTPEQFANISLPIASVADLACMKLSAISSRGARRDFWDLHLLLGGLEGGLAEALTLYQRKFPVDDIGHVVRSLCYFADAEAEPPMAGLSPEHWETIKSDFRARVKAL